jgi:hypothetical protein
MAACPRTHAYIAKRRAEGKSDNEIRHSIKRYIARELYRTLHLATALGKRPFRREMPSNLGRL